MVKKWRCIGEVSGGKYLGVVEAENEEEAKKKGFNLGEAYVSLCCQCSNECENAEIHEIVVEELELGETE